MLRQFYFYIGLVVSFLLSAYAVADEEIAVIYPDAPAPFNEIFKDILEGVEEAHGGSIDTFVYKKKDTPQKAIDWLKMSEPKAVIALASQGYRVAKALNNEYPLLVGALPIRPNGLSGISLVPAPANLFASLQTLAPSVRKIHIVYSHRSAWTIPLAEAEAKRLGYGLHSVQVSTVKEALTAYDNLLENFNVMQDALWIPLDPISGHEQVIVPNLLERSWEQNIVLFSSKPAHVKRGALFSLFPDHKTLGKSLVNMLKTEKNLAETPVVKPMTNTQLAVNLRTAAHLGFEYKNKQKSQFHLTFPE